MAYNKELYNSRRVVSSLTGRLEKADEHVAQGTWMDHKEVHDTYPKEFPDAAVLEGSNITKSLARTIYPAIM